MDGSGRERTNPFGANHILGAIVAWALRLLGSTWRVEISGPDPFVQPGDGPVLGALLHRDFLIAAWAFRDRGIHVGVSRSRDGDLVDAVLGRLGYGASARGSSSQGGASAQRALLERLRAGRSVAVVVDGPRGPAGVAKPGIAQLATTTGHPIIPVRFEAGFAWRFGSWDRALLPLPFAQVECRFGEPVNAVDGDEAAALEEVARRLA